jgi:hypothetical protein
MAQRDFEPPPPPDRTAPFSHLGEEEIESRYSRSGLYRIIVSRDRAGRYRIHRQRWDTGDWDVARVAQWLEDDRMATITDTLENARSLARQRLEATPDGPA